MKYKTKIHKIVSLTILFCLFNQIFTPSVVFALTSGPTSPEATSFEPVDTTDMVNPLTGDFVYNLPLMEVPGAEGGYPLTLSYHAGLQPNEDASWVGAGWSLNPGAINRSVNGFPDDWYGATSNRRDYWVGGVRSKTSVGVNIPIFGNLGSASFGLSFSNDTYDGRRVGWDAGIGFGIPNSPFSIGVGIGVSSDDGSAYAYGQVGVTKGPFSLALGISTQGPYASAGLELSGGSKGFSISEGLNISTNFKSLAVNMSGQASYGVLGISMSSNNPSPSLSVAGFTASTSNSKQGNISSYTSSVSVNLIVASYSREKTRYWSDEQEISEIFGGLHQMNYVWGDVPSQYAYDNYSLPDENLSAVSNPDPSKLQGGALPSYDSYQVTAQGLGGTMRPYTFEGITMSQNRTELINSAPTETIHYYSNFFIDYPEFRFDNDFSNNYLQDYNDFPELNDHIYIWAPPFSGPTPIDNEWYNGGGGGNTLAGSRHVDYYTTTNTGAVNNYNNKFIYPVAQGLNRRAHTYQSGLNNHIAGFSITNSNGVTYHYNLPAYAYEEEIYQENTSYASGDMFNRQRKHEGYAYTWYLTAITGPDYVDRGTIGEVDGLDYGYWVSFEYGKWLDQYSWRNPSEGYQVDDDAQFRTVSMGKKEVYYLNTVRTRSHVAIFEKDARKDAKSASAAIFNTNGDKNYTNDGIYDINSMQSMKLDKIYLLNAPDYNILQNSSPGIAPYFIPGRINPGGIELPDNVIDKYDIDATGRSFLESKSIRIIDFDYDYSLSKGTSNSFEPNSSTVKDGKLTLKSVKFRGKGGVSLLPSTDFSYDLDAQESQPFTGTLSSGSFQGTPNAFKVGDLLTNVNTGAFYGVVTSINNSSGSSAIYTLKNSTYNGSAISVTVKTTKNPPYNKELYDIWGMYKPDFNNTGNNNLDRATTPVSNIATDVWSLRKVTTGLGGEVKIKYEGDTYSRSVLNEARPFSLSGATTDGGTDYHFTVMNLGALNLSDLFHVGDHVSMVTLSKTWVGAGYEAICSDDYPAPVVTAINGNLIYLRLSPAQHAYMASTGLVVGGNIGFSGMSRKFGGGIRVKSLTVDDVFGGKTSTNYSYNLFDSGNESSISSGVTSYEPISVDKYGLGISDANTYQIKLYQDMNKLMSLSREVPGPGVMYSNVGIDTEVFDDAGTSKGKLAGRKTMEFEVFRENMIGKEDVTAPRWADKSTWSKYYTRNLVLKKFLTGIGSLKRIISYDDKGAKLNETINHYLSDGLEHLKHKDFLNAYENRLIKYKKQGLLKERYSEAKAIYTGHEDNWDIKATFTARENYPNIQTGQTVVDYVTGVTRSTVNEEFDFYSGAATKTISSDSYGNRYLQETVPAYRKYPEMGLKTQSSANKNMLAQETASYTYKVDGTNQKLGLIGASISTWGVDVPVLNREKNVIYQNDALADGKVWRKKAVYSWQPPGQTANGITEMSNATAFNWASPESSGSNWLKVSENTLFDVYSNTREDKNVSGLFSAIRMGYNDTKILASASPARYAEMIYSGAEDGMFYSSEITGGFGTISTNVAHTGTKSIRVTSAVVEPTRVFLYTVPLNQLDPVRKDYVMSVWVRGEEASYVNRARLYYSIDGQPLVLGAGSLNKVAAGWYLLEMKIPASAIAAGSTNLSIGCANLNNNGPVYFDDFRFHPAIATMVSYVYDTFSGELTHILDSRNLFTKYEYDAAGRMTGMYKEVLGKPSTVKVKEVKYHYRRAGI